MSIESQFVKISEQLLGDDCGVEQGRMLNSAGLKISGRFFAFTTKSQLVVKLPAARVTELIANGAGQPCEPRKGRPMREWILLTPTERGLVHRPRGRSARLRRRPREPLAGQPPDQERVVDLTLRKEPAGDRGT